MVFRGARILTAAEREGAKVYDPGVLVVQDGKIAAVGPADKVETRLTHDIFTLRRVMTDAERPIAPGQAHPTFACPDCRGPLQPDDDTLLCQACDTAFTSHDGVPVLLPQRLRSARLDLIGGPAEGGLRSADRAAPTNSGLSP